MNVFILSFFLLTSHWTGEKNQTVDCNQFEKNILLYITQQRKHFLSKKKDASIEYNSISI